MSKNRNDHDAKNEQTPPEAQVEEEVVDTAADSTDSPEEGTPDFREQDDSQEKADVDETVDEIAGAVAGRLSLQQELDEAQDRALRLQAELDNVRKRASRQIQEERLYACMPLLRDLLPVLDNMDRAIEAAEKTHDTAGLLEGVKMVASQFVDALGKHDCNEIPALHEHFDPNLHHAISQLPTDEHDPNVIITVAQAGFQLHDRVVRPSQVILAAEMPTEDA